jgi:hypothetical protein
MMYMYCENEETGHTVGVFRCVLESTMSRKSAAVGTGAMALSPLVDMVENLSKIVATSDGDRWD